MARVIGEIAHDQQKQKQNMNRRIRSGHSSPQSNKKYVPTARIKKASVCRPGGWSNNRADKLSGFPPHAQTLALRGQPIFVLASSYYFTGNQLLTFSRNTATTLLEKLLTHCAAHPSRGAAIVVLLVRTYRVGVFALYNNRSAMDERRGTATGQ